LYVLGQCEGSLGNYDGGDCVNGAEKQAILDRGHSISAQIIFLVWNKLYPL